MPGFLDRLKSGADKAAFEADRMLRLNQAQSALKALERDLDKELTELGRKVLVLHDAGTLTQPELQESLAPIDELRQKLAAQRAEVERIRQEKPPEAESEQPVEPPQPAAPPRPVVGTGEEPAAEAPSPAAQGTVCPRCQTPLPPNVRFCPECGYKVGED
jgi:peptidoglycan hydrolase CwlO-like protein